MSQSGSIGVQSGPSPSGNTTTLISGDIDLTVPGVVPLFTTSAGNSFITTLITVRSINIQGLVSDAVYNIGTNAPDYDNILSGNNTGLMVSGTSNSTIQNNMNIVVPASTQISLNIIVSMIATTGLFRFYLTGILN